MTQETKPTGVKRREFLKVLGASSATLAITACDEPTGKLIPYLVSPDQTVPGVSTYYATTCRECSAGCGVIAETRDGRAIKLEGNPDHPLNHGALCARGQSALQGLYNPDRFRAPMVNENGAWKTISWDDAITRSEHRRRRRTLGESGWRRRVPQSARGRQFLALSRHVAQCQRHAGASQRRLRG
jgi:molybdopterin-containing oxidoreductase family iron-sulfur binding subunit